MRKSIMLISGEPKDEFKLYIEFALPFSIPTLRQISMKLSLFKVRGVHTQILSDG